MPRENSPENSLPFSSGLHFFSLNFLTHVRFKISDEAQGAHMAALLYCPAGPDTFTFHCEVQVLHLGAPRTQWENGSPPRQVPWFSELKPSPISKVLSMVRRPRFLHLLQKKVKTADGISVFFDHPFTDFEQKKATWCLAMVCVKTSTPCSGAVSSSQRAFPQGLQGQRVRIPNPGERPTSCVLRPRQKRCFRAQWAENAS